MIEEAFPTPLRGEAYASGALAAARSPAPRAILPAVPGLALAFFLAAAGATSSAADLEPITVEQRMVDTVVVFDGVVESARQASIAAQVTGRVLAVGFEAGQSIRKGALLLRIDERESIQVVASAEAQVAQARATLANARAHYERTRTLFEQKFVSAAAVDSAQAEFRAAEAQLASVTAGAAQASTARGYTTIVAPFDGVVATRMVEVGDLATPGKPLLTLFDPASLRVLATVPQYRVPELKLDVPASVAFPSLGLSVPSKAATLIPSADARTHASQVRLDLPAAVSGVFPGMYAQARFSVGRSRRLVVPEGAVLRRSEVTAVYVLDARGSPRLRQVRLGEALGEGWVEVLAGVSAGERIAADPVKAGITLKGGSTS